MIKSKEQYEQTKKADALLIQGTGVKTLKSSDLIETIEALREVARAGQNLVMFMTEGGPVGLVPDAFQDALDALPDWILEE